MSKPPSWNQIRADAAVFAARWSDETDENAGAQSFWNEFLALFGVDRKRVAVFEKRAERVSTGGRGRIDLFWPGVLIAEHKSAGKDLQAAEDQALDYLESIDQDDFPGLLVTSDFARMRVVDLGGDHVAYEFPLTDLVKEIDRFAYLAGYSGRQLKQAREHEVDIAAARLMGSLYEKVSATGFSEHEVSVFLVRMLFVMFADDTGLWEKSLFLEYLESRTQADGSDLGPQLAMLFQTLDRPDDRRSPALDELLARFPYVNGGLFSDRLDIPAFDHEVRDVLVQCCLIDWGSIVPAIFGSLFQAVKSKEDRRLLGEHYTTEQNILRTIGPLFLDDLRAELDASFHDVKRLNRLRDKLGLMKFIDPACGCGNFLVIAYREMRMLELDIMVRLQELTGASQLALDATLGLRVSPAQFHGIELEEWPARIAETAMFLIDHQQNQVLARRFGEAPDRLPISTAADIHVGNAVQMNWADVLPPSDDVYVLGNPPFHGAVWMSPGQVADRQEAFARIGSSGARTGRLDYVSSWYASAIRYLQGTRARAAFVSTNSLTQGEQGRVMLEVFQQHGFAIDFAHRTFKWTSEAPGAAAVHVVIVGFSMGGQAKAKRLFDYADINGEPKEVTARNINFFLVDAPDVAPSRQTRPLIDGIATAAVGSKPADGGFLVVTSEDVDEVRADPVAAKYLRPLVGATEMLYNKSRWCLWLRNAEPADIRESPLLRNRLAGVRATREASSSASIRRQALTPTLFSHDAQPDTRYLALPEVSSEGREYLPGRFYDSDTIASNKLIVWPDAPLWLFATVQSSLFTAWVRTYSGRLKSDFQIAPGTVCNTFPFAVPEGSDLVRVEEAAKAVLAARTSHPTANMATLYDPVLMPVDLRSAHVRLDKVMDALYGLRSEVTEGDRLRALIARYQALTTLGQLPLGEKKGTRPHR